MIPEVDIWKSFLQGDKAALKQLMQVYYKPLFHYGSKYSEDAELVKDCIQELFIGLWDRRMRLSVAVNPKPYLMASLRRALHRKLQSESRLLKYKAAGSDYFNLELSIEQKMIDSESLQLVVKRIAEAMAKLPKRQKEVIYLKFFQNLSREEIAKVMGNNPQTVSNLLQLALKKLRVDFKYSVTTSIATLLFLLCYLCA
jgi:RNA polymerase sigma factor (sigma-70 family)